RKTGETCRGAVQSAPGFLADFTRKRLAKALARLDAAARQVPARKVGMLHQHDVPLLQQHGPYAERHAARKARECQECPLAESLVRSERHRRRLSRPGVS